MSNRERTQESSSNSSNSDSDSRHNEANASPAAAVRDRSNRAKTLKEKNQLPPPSVKEEMSSLIWTDLEKVALIDSLNKYGYLSKYTYKCLKTKSEDQIKHFLRTRMRQARDRKKRRMHSGSYSRASSRMKSQNSENVKAPLEDWIKYFTSNLPEYQGDNSTSQQLILKLLPCAFFIMSNFEAHPDPIDSCGINFKEFYEFLYTSLLGMPSKMLSKSTASFLFTAFYDSCKHYKNIVQTAEAYYLNAIQNVPDKPATLETSSGVRTYPGKKKIAQFNEGSSSGRRNEPNFMEQILKIQSLNPLKIPIHHLENPDSININSVEK